LSCDRIKRNGAAAVDKAGRTVAQAKQKISSKKNQLADKIFPGFDSEKPDTENNKRRFREYLEVDLIEDVRNIYCYGDFLGADYKVLIAFSCDPITIDKVIAVKKMQQVTSKDDDGLFFSENFKWWDKDRIKMLQPSKVGKEEENWQYLWYDPKTKQAYFEAYSL